MSPAVSDAGRPVNGVTGAVLSGGRNARMGGRNKALLPFLGAPLIARPLGVLRGVFPETVIISNEPAAYASFGARVIPDVIKDKGPLGGLHAALSAGGGRAVFAAACDMPFLDGALVRRLARDWLSAGGGAIVPKAGGLLEPLCAVYGTELAGALGGFLSKNRDLSVRAFLRTVPVRVIDLGGGAQVRRAFGNLNFPEDFEGLARR